MTGIHPDQPPPSAEEVEAFKGAAKKGDRALVTAYLDRYGSAYVDQTHRDRMTALIYAAWMGYADLVALLLDRGADINQQGNLGKTALSFAAFQGEAETVALLLERGADPAIADNHGWSASYWARQLAYNEVVDMIERWPEISLQRKAASEEKERHARNQAQATAAETNLEKLQRQRPARPALKRTL